MSNDYTFSEVEGEKWGDGRLDRADAFIEMYQDSIRKNQKALELLQTILHEESEHIRIGRKMLIVRGELASYCISVKELLERFNNAYSNNSGVGFSRVEVHPVDHWVREHSSACIQVDSPMDMPSIDTLISLLLGLKNDVAMFGEEGIPQLRDALIERYGFELSPITEVLSDFLATKYGAINDIDEGEIRMEGSNGWTWHFGYRDPEVPGFRLSSSVRGGPKRLHLVDTREGISYSKDIERILELFSSAPRCLMNGNKYRLSRSIDLCRTIAEVYAPLRRAIEEDGIEEWVDIDAAGEWF